jgi:hypothetical protein
MFGDGPPDFAPTPSGGPLIEDFAMSLKRLSDAWIIRMYEGIRKEVAADMRGNVHLIGEATKQRAGHLADELIRRDIRFAPIEWPAEVQVSPPRTRTVRWKASLEAFAALARPGRSRRRQS